MSAVDTSELLHSLDCTELNTTGSILFLTDLSTRFANNSYNTNVAVDVGVGFTSTGAKRRVLRATGYGTIPTCSTAGTHVQDNIVTLPYFYGDGGFCFINVSYQESGGHFVSDNYRAGSNASNSLILIRADVTKAGVFRVSNGVTGLSGGTVYYELVYLSTLTVANHYVGDSYTF